MRNLFGGLCLIIAGLFSTNELVYPLGLMFGGLFFIQFHRNWREGSASICLALSGPLLSLGYTWAMALVPVSGLCLFAAQPVNNIPISSRFKYLISICLIYSVIPLCLIIAGLLVCLLSLVHFFEYADDQPAFIEYEG